MCSGVLPGILDEKALLDVCVLCVYACMRVAVSGFSVIKQNILFLDLAPSKPRIWNLYSEFSRKARTFEWVPTLELWEDSVLGIYGFEVLLTCERRIYHRRRHQIKSLQCTENRG